MVEIFTNYNCFAICSHLDFCFESLLMFLKNFIKNKYFSTERKQDYMT